MVKKKKKKSNLNRFWVKEINNSEIKRKILDFTNYQFVRITLYFYFFLKNMYTQCM